MRDRVRFDRKKTGRDAYGNEAEGWQEGFLKTYGDILETLGKERVAAGRLEGSATATLRVRGSVAASGITAADRVFMRGGLWSILGLARVGRKGETLEFLCERGGAL
jgi:head-tail adaptor